MTRWIQTINSRLQHKLIAAFLACVPLVALSGGAGLWFVNDVGMSVTVLAEVASPLVDSANELIVDAATAQMSVADALRDRTTSAISAAESSVATQETTIKTIFDRMKQLSAASTQTAAIGAPILEAEELSAQFLDQAQQTVAALRTNATLEARALGAQADLEKVFQSLNDSVKTLTERSEAAMNAIEDGGRTLQQSGNASTYEMERLLESALSETYPLLKSTYRLRSKIDAMVAKVNSAIDERDSAALPTLQNEFAALLKSTRDLHRQVGLRGNDEVKEQAAAMAPFLDQVEKFALGPQAL